MDRDHNKKFDDIVYTALTIIGTICLFSVIILGSFHLMIFYKGFYFQEYYKNGVYAKLSSNETQAMTMAQNITDNIFDYFHGKAELNYFDAKEVSHMQDVKNLIALMDMMYYLSAIIFVCIFFYIYIQFNKDIMKFLEKTYSMIIYGAIAAMVFLVLFFIITVFYFEPFFIMFHLLFFPQGNWVFAPTSLLITIFPEQFFIDITLRIFVFALVQAIVFLIIGIWVRKNVRLHHKYNR